jgi:hypothetical protein
LLSVRCICRSGVPIAKSGVTVGARYWTRSVEGNICNARYGWASTHGGRFYPWGCPDARPFPRRWSSLGFQGKALVLPPDSRSNYRDPAASARRHPLFPDYYAVGLSGCLVVLGDIKKALGELQKHPNIYRTFGNPRFSLSDVGPSQVASQRFRPGFTAQSGVPPQPR